MQLTQARLKELLSYDPETGIFLWLSPTSNRVKRGQQAGSNSHGYLTVRLDHRLHKLHRLAWFYMTGNWPAQMIDHRNGQRADNRFANLREANVKENNRNVSRQANNTTGFKGVSRHGVNFRAECYADGHRIRVSGFETPEAAAQAAQHSRSKLHGEFANHGMNT